jgi:hypothetical protein
LTVTTISIIGGLVTALAATAATMWRQRSRGPESQATLIGAADTLIRQLQDRVLVLERRVADVETINDRLDKELNLYYRSFGPLPEPDPPIE